MPFFKYLLAASALLGSTLHAADPAIDITKGSDAQKAYIERLNKSGALEQFKNIEEKQKYQQYETQAKQIADTTLDKLAVSLETYADVDPKDAQAFSSSPKDLRKETMTGIFVSFSMTDYELQEAFKAAEENGGELYFNGMHPDDDSIGKTMVRLRKLMANHETTATARFHPKAFQEFDIKGVPAIIYARKGTIGIAHGTLNFDYLKKLMEDTSGINDFGLLGNTRLVKERNLLDEIKERLTKIDGEKLQRQAVDNFWKKKEFVFIPPAQKTETFYINPTIKVTEDILNNKGEALARKGQVFNPLATMTMNNTYILFDATEPRQLEWVDKKISANQYKGIVMLMTSQLHKETGWDHLSSLRKHFTREIYLIPKELVDRFSISGLPAIVTTDNQLKMIKIEQISIKDNP